MQAKRSYRTLSKVGATAHILEVTVGGVVYKVEHIVSCEEYLAVDPEFISHVIETKLWADMMQALELNLRKNLIHA